MVLSHRRRDYSPVAGREPIDSWRDLAACAGLDVRLFYPDTGKRSTAALTVCSGCWVRGDCLEYALARDEAHGVWGGKTEDERRAIRRARRAAS